MKRLVLLLVLFGLTLAAPIERAGASSPGLSAWYNDGDGYLYLKGYDFTPGGTVHIDIDAYDLTGAVRHDHLVTTATAAPWSGIVWWGARADFYVLDAGEFRIASSPYGPHAGDYCLIGFKIAALDKSTGQIVDQGFDMLDCGQ